MKGAIMLLPWMCDYCTYCVTRAWKDLLRLCILWVLRFWNPSIIQCQLTFRNAAGLAGRQLCPIPLPRPSPLPAPPSLSNLGLVVITEKECWNVYTQSFAINWKWLFAAVWWFPPAGESLGCVRWIFCISFTVTCGKTVVGEAARPCRESGHSTRREGHWGKWKAFVWKDVLRSKVADTIFHIISKCCLAFPLLSRTWFCIQPAKWAVA